MRGRAALCLLVLLAGCSGFGGAGGEPTATVTPAPVPEDTGAGSYPPGIGADGVTDPVALGEAHYRAIQRTSYTMRRTRTVRAVNGSLLARTDLSGQFSANRSQFHVDYTVTGSDAAFAAETGRLVLWTDGEVLLRSVTSNGTTTRQRFPAEVFSQRPGPFGNSPGDALGLSSPDREAYWLVTAFETNARPATKNGSVLVTGTTLTRPAALETLEDVDDPRSASLRAVVEPDGLVRAYALSYVATVDGRTVRVEKTVRYSAVGSTRIERPSWYDEVVNGAEE